ARRRRSGAREPREAEVLGGRRADHRRGAARGHRAAAVLPRRRGPDRGGTLLLEPRIAERMTLVWIGGNEHEGLAYPPPGGMPIEYNLLIDPIAGQVVFNDSEIPLWQVP